MLKVVVFNAPPRTGKGIAAEHMVKVINSTEGFLTAYQKEFKDELFKIAANILGVTVGHFKKDYDRKTPDDVWWCKDLVSLSTSCHGEKVNYSQREWLIHVSENVIKPAFGEDAFGKSLVESLPKEGVVFVSDGGFIEEILPLINHCGKDNILIVHIDREGCDFSNDSRDYLKPEMFEENLRPKFASVENNGSIGEFQDEVEKVVGEWMNG